MIYNLAVKQKTLLLQNPIFKKYGYGYRYKYVVRGQNLLHAHVLTDNSAEFLSKDHILIQTHTHS